MNRERNDSGDQRLGDAGRQYLDFPDGRVARLRVHSLGHRRGRAPGQRAESLSPGLHSAGYCPGHLFLLRTLHLAAERGAGVAPLRRLSRHGSHERLSLDRSLELESVASRSAPETSTATSSKSTTNAATRSKSRPSWSGASRTRSRACFDVDNYDAYVHIQSESAVRHLASSYAYDHGEPNELTLRSSVDEVSTALQKELQARLAKAGVLVDEARLTHLAYAPEIAGVMLRRQQAEAIINARQKMVRAAVSMVQMALHDLAKNKIVELDKSARPRWSAICWWSSVATGTPSRWSTPERSIHKAATGGRAYGGGRAGGGHLPNPKQPAQASARHQTRESTVA